jgi:hypothetical protein
MDESRHGWFPVNKIALRGICNEQIGKATIGRSCALVGI